MRYPYEYFSGANISVAIGKSKIEEAVGISYNVMDSKQPIYGYSSVLFDAVAPGQILVQGSLAINFVTSNYLFHSIMGDRAAVAGVTSSTIAAVKPPEELITPPKNSNRRDVLLKQLTKAMKDKDEKRTLSIINELKADLMPSLAEEEMEKLVTVSKSPLLAGPVNITIRFGAERDSELGAPEGVHTINIVSAYFIGRASTIQIDENVILEEYPFFARAILTDKKQLALL
jgi:hypothetical protein